MSAKLVEGGGDIAPWKLFIQKSKLFPSQPDFFLP